MSEPNVDFVRPEDLLTVTVRFENLRLRSDSLERIDLTQSAGLTLVLPPQHFREALTSRFDQPLELAAALPSMMMFNLPEGVASVPVGEDGLLGVCQRLSMDRVMPLYFPARVYLKPLDGEWSLGVAAATYDGGTELWRARLIGPVHMGAVRARFEIASVLSDELPAWPTLPEGGVLFQRYFHGIMEASRFDLSPLGASVRMVGPVGYGPDLLVPESLAEFIGSYEHDADFGRDSRVRLVTRGHLSSGHPATMVQLNRRAFRSFVNQSGDPAQLPEFSYAVLEAMPIIHVDDPVLDVDVLADAYGGPARNMPLRTLRLFTDRTPPLDPGAVSTDSPFWVRTSAGTVPFALQGVDWEGRTIDFELPLVFIPHSPAPDHALLEAVLAQGQREAVVRSAPVALAPPRVPHDGSTSVTVERLTLGVQQSFAAGGSPGSRPPALPVLKDVTVILDAAATLTGLREPVRARFHDAYLANGMDGGGNPLGAYLSLASPLPVSLDPRQVGGLAKPDLTLGAVTAAKGAVPAGFELDGRPDVNTLLQQLSGSKILGLVELKEVLGLLGLDPGSVVPPDIKAPTMLQRSTPTELVLDYDWAAPIKPNGSVLQPTPGQQSTITLKTHTVRRLLDNATTSVVEGLLTQVDIVFEDVVRVHFDRLQFRAEPGGPPTVTPDGIELVFEGPLAFLQDLQEALSRTGLGKASVDVTSGGITAGFTAALPTLALGMFSVTDLSIKARLGVPFDGRPVSFVSAVAERYRPFGVSVSMFRGGGFFALELDTEGIRRIEASLEFGGSMSLDIVVASGSVHVMAGIYFLYADGAVTIAGFLRAGGQVSVLGIIMITAEFYMQLSYQSASGKVHGQASLTIGVKVLFFSKSVTLSIERTFAGSAGDPTFTDCFELEDWQEYCDAFA